MRSKSLFILIINFLLSSAVIAPSILADDGIVRSDIQLSRESVISYWTKERVKNAVPYPMEIVEMEEGELIPPGTVPSPADGEPISSPSRLPSLKGSLSSKDIKRYFGSPELLPPSLSVEPKHVPYPFPYTRFEVLGVLYSRYPYTAIGKVFFVQGGGNWVCSGASIGGRAVLTAGHCVCDGAGNFHTNWQFVPAYRDNNRPYGTWTAYSLSTHVNWCTYGQFCRDVGIAFVSDIGGLKLSQRVGKLGYQCNQNAERTHWNIFGYPAVAPFNGERMYECQACFGVWDLSAGGDYCTPYPLGVGCDQTGGASGGPWIKNFVPGFAGAMNYANSVNSYKYTSSQPRALYGPYFDTWVCNFIANAILQ